MWSAPVYYFVLLFSFGFLVFLFAFVWRYAQTKEKTNEESTKDNVEQNQTNSTQQKVNLTIFFVFYLTK
jgi:cytoskeletal protein RodZ